MDITIDQDSPGKQGYRFITRPGKEIWVKELSDGEWAVCFLNTRETDLEIRVKWPHLYFLRGTYKIRDIWTGKDIGITKKDHSFNISPHDVALLKFTPVK